MEPRTIGLLIAITVMLLALSMRALGAYMFFKHKAEKMHRIPKDN